MPLTFHRKLYFQQSSEALPLMLAISYKKVVSLQMDSRLTAASPKPAITHGFT